MKSELKRFYQRAAASLRTAKIAPPSAHKGRLLLTLLMMLLTTATAWAQEAIDGLTYNSTGGYYEINDEQDLIDLATYVNAGNNASGKTFLQTLPITMTGSNFTPIGIGYKNNKSDWFAGTYDGGGHTISGLSVSYSLADVGFFSNVYYGTVRNVILVSPSVTNTKGSNISGFSVGALIGYTFDGTVENCLVISPTLNATGSGDKYYGALVGESGSSDDIFTNCCYYTDNASLAGIGKNPKGDVSRAYTVTLGDGVTTSTAAAFTCNGTDYYKSGAIVTLPAAPAGYINAYTVNGLPIDGTSFTISADATVALSRTPDPADFADNGDGTYTIKTATGWSVFCDCLDDNDTYNRFSGKTVRLADDITVTRMAGSDHHDFCGTFDGQGHTLTLDISSDSRPYTAPFAYVSETTPTGGNEVSHPAIRNLNVTGTVNATKVYASGLVGAFWGTLTIENCTSSVTVNTSNKYAAGFISNAQGNAIIRNCLSSATINSTVSGDGTHAGFIGVAGSVNLNIEGCAFTGSLLGTSTTSCAGFVGYGGTVTITNSLYAPAEVTVQNDNSATFARGNTPSTTNCYYTAALGDAQGKAARSVTAGDNVTISGIALTGTATQYTVSGITAYSGGGLKRGDVLYYGSGDQLSLTLSNSATGAPQGYQYTYTASAGTLSGTTLTMPDQDVTISVNTAALAAIDWATVNQGNSADPYMIYNKDQLLLLAHRVNGTNGETANDYDGKYFKLGANITFTHAADEGDDYAENYEAIGGYYNGTYRNFRGTFDGANHTVSGIRIRKTGSGAANCNQGLFGRIDSGADIYDVHLTDARIIGYMNVGGIAGYNIEGYISGCTVTDSYITATTKSNYGTICGRNDYTIRLRNNYYHGCTVNGTAVTSGKGCNGADITAKNGALPAYAITLGENITTPPGTFVGQNEWLTTPPVNPRLAPENGFTLAGNHYFASGYEFTPGSTLASGAAQGYTPRATLGGQLLDLYTPTGDADPLAGKAIARLTITADCDGKTLASTEAIYSTGQPVTVAYIKADGTPDEASAIALDGTETSLAAGTYFAGLENVNFDHTLNLTGDVNLILADGCTMNIGTSESRISGNGIARENGGDKALTIYGQNAGTGALNVYTGNGNNGIVAKAVTINGGNVTTDANETWSDGIYVEDDIIINGGTVNATATGNNTWGLYANCNLTINGGNVNATGGANGIRATANVAINGGNVNATGGANGIRAGGTITLGWTRPADRIYANSYRGIVSVKAGQAFVTDEATPAVIGGTISDLAVINGKTLKPATFYLVGNMTNPEWTVNADYQLTVNPGNTSELMIQNVPLTTTTQFKVVYSADGTAATTWYPGNGGNYGEYGEITADGIYDIYFRPDYGGGMDWFYGCIYAADVSNIEVAFAPEGFATYYHGTFDVKLPEGVKARIVTSKGSAEGTLTYETIADGDTNDKVVPAGTAVMLQTEKSTEAQQKTLTLAVHGADSPAAPTLNLLHGSDVEGTTTGDGKHYKLTYGNDNTPNADVFGWYWGSADGAAFTSPAHKAWLVLPADANARSFFGLPDDDTTGIVNAEANWLSPSGRRAKPSSLFTLHSSLSEWYTIDGMKLSGKPTAKGVYILNGRKIVIK